MTENNPVIAAEPMDEIVRPQDGIKLLKISRTTLHVWVCTGIFPRPRRCGPNSVGWLKSTVQAWLEALPPAATRRGGAPSGARPDPRTRPRGVCGGGRLCTRWRSATGRVLSRRCVEERSKAVRVSGRDLAVGRLRTD